MLEVMEGAIIEPARDSIEGYEVAGPVQLATGPVLPSGAMTVPEPAIRVPYRQGRDESIG